MTHRIREIACAFFGHYWDFTNAPLRITCTYCGKHRHP